MWLEWHGSRITFIRDYRYVRYVTPDAELTLTTRVRHTGGNAALRRAARFS
jgi:RNA polymerase sigma-70 factor (ECF subfamily)